VTDALEQFRDDIKEELARSPSTTFGIVGHTPEAYELHALFTHFGAEQRLLGIYAPLADGSANVLPLARLRVDKPDALIIAADAEKESLLLAAQPYVAPECRVIIAGYKHLEFRDPIFERVINSALVPSLANGYPSSLIHLYQCLRTAAARGLDGVVAEFGVFKGGTTFILSRFVEELGQNWKILGFDTFAGFPPKRSLLDMYAHPDCVFDDENSVRHYLEGRNVELVKGNLEQTAQRLANEEVVLGFFDTDNFTSTSAALDVIQDRVLVGGALVFDHFTGVSRFRYTLGERLAAARLLEDPRYVHLHGTGVFFRHR
jgi:hypothetical protein